MSYQGHDKGALPPAVGLTAYPQYATDEQSVLQVQQQQQLAEGQVLQQEQHSGHLLLLQQQQEHLGMLGLQQQQLQLMLQQHEVGQSVASGAVVGTDVGGQQSPAQLRSLLAAAAHAGNRSASSELLYQLIREQEMLAQLVQDPEWQQPVVNLPNQAEQQSQHAEVYPTGHGTADAAGSSFPGELPGSLQAHQALAQQQQQQEQQQEQQSVLQQMLLEHHRHQQQLELGVLQQCLMQQHPALVHRGRSRSAGGASQPRAAPAGYTCFMGMASAASENAMNAAMDATMNAALASDASGGLMCMQLPAGADAVGLPSEWLASQQGSYVADQAIHSLSGLLAADAAEEVSMGQSFSAQQQQQAHASLPLQPGYEHAQQQQAQQQELMPQQQGVTGPEGFDTNASWGQDQGPDPSDFSLDDLEDLLVGEAAADEPPTDPMAELRSLSAVHAQETGGPTQSHQQEDHHHQHQQQQHQETPLQQRDEQCLLRTADSAPA
jgi:hypothetical protein